jgi:DNA-nicking Smr family endonuclease
LGQRGELTRQRKISRDENSQTLATFDQSAVVRDVWQLNPRSKEVVWLARAKTEMSDNPDYAGPDGNRLRAEAQAQAEKRGQYFTESQTAFQSGDKAKAKELSELGKAAGQKMEELNQEAAKVILKYRNDGHPDTYLDLHGLYLEEAVTAFHQRLELLQNKKSGEEVIFEVIPGAGNHSKNKAIIKPKIIEELQVRKLRFEEKNAGTLLVYLPPTASGGAPPKAAPAPATKKSEVTQPSTTNEATTSTDAAGSSGGVFGCCIVM